MAGDAKKQALRDLANQHEATWGQLEKHDPDSAAMHSRYNPDTGLPVWYREEKGFFGKTLGWAWDKWVGLNEYVHNNLGEGEAVPESPLQALEMMDRAIKQGETPERAQQMVEEAKAAAPMEEGADPEQVAESRLRALQGMVGGGEQERPVSPAVTTQLPARPKARRKRMTLLEKYYDKDQPASTRNLTREARQRPGLFETLNSLDRRVEAAIERR
jgi:hypothetical protein